MRHAILKEAVNMELKEGREKVYLIEYQQKDNETATWYTGLWFSADINDAARFPIKTHAESALMRLQVDKDMNRLRLTVTEHIWIDIQD